LQTITGTASEQTLLLGLNRIGDGYRIVNANHTLIESAAGHLLAMQFTGTGLITQVKQEGEHRLDYYQFDYAATNGALLLTQSTPFYGDLIASNGSLLWVRYGDLISTLHVTSSGFVANLGTTLSEPMIASQSHGNDLLVLTESGLSRFGIQVERLPSVSQTSFIALKDQTGFIANDFELLTWNDSEIERHQLQSDGSLVSFGAMPLDGRVIDSAIDGTIIWIKVVNTLGSHWQAYQAGELVGVLPSTAKVDGRAFASNRAYFSHPLFKLAIC